MLDRLFKKPGTIRRFINAPWLKDRQRYLAYLAQKGYKQEVIRRSAYYQLIIVRYLPLEGDRILTLNEVTSAAKRWASYSVQHYRDENIDRASCKRRFIMYATQWLRFWGRLEIPIQSMPRLITEFAEHLQNERGLSESTIRSICQRLQWFFNRIKEEPDQFLTHLTPSRIDNLLIQEFYKGGYARSTILGFLWKLRSFLRYSASKGWCCSTIADSIRSPRMYKQQALPSSPSWSDVQRLLKTTEGNDPMSIRDRAILLLLTVYGLRSKEIRGLRFQDFDWEKEVFNVRRSKGGLTQQFPLTQTVGEALIRYIRKARPRDSSYDEIFLTMLAPIRPLKTLFNIVSRRWQPLNVAIQHYGSHSLRHACATRLINKGVSIKTIADQLGHRCLDTTGIYAKVDLTSLREVANFNMGGLS